MRYCSFKFLFLLFASLFYLKNVEAQNVNNDSNNISKYSGYFSMSLFSGASLLFPNNVNHEVSLNFPYQITDSSWAVFNKQFNFPGKKIYHAVKVFVLPLDFDFGGWKHGANIGAIFQMFPNGYTSTVALSAGYGRLWYFNGSQPNKKRNFIVKTSFNAVYNVEGGGNGESQFGSIDNENNTINVLGYTANPSYTISSSSSGRYYTKGGTYAAKNLDVAFTQREISILPKISVCSNPYKGGKPIMIKKKQPDYSYVGKVFWEFSLGYNIAVYDKGGIIFTQDDGNFNDKTKKLAGPINLHSNAFVFSSNNKPATSTPYHFSGFYISFMVRPGRSWVD